MMANLRNWVRNWLMTIRVRYLQLWGHQVDITSRISFSAFLDKTYPAGVVIGARTLIAREAVILSHDYTRSLYATTLIGCDCLIGTRAIVLPGVVIGDHVVVGAGSVVTRNVPPYSLVAGNPAKLIRKISTKEYGKIIESEQV